MISFNSLNTSQQFHTGILENRHITVQASAEATGYNIQYLRRMLRSGMLKGCKIGQMWLIEKEIRAINLPRLFWNDENQNWPLR